MVRDDERPAGPASTGGGGIRSRVEGWARRPLVLLAVIAAASSFMRCFRLDKPSGLMGDEIFYVNAARDIAGNHSAASPLRFLAGGLDSNPAHPPLAKLLMGGSIRAFGDNPAAWRIPSVIFGTAAILLMYWLVRTAGGAPAIGLGAAALMSVDNLMVVHGRMATLDIFVVTFMIVAVALYLRGNWALAGVAIAFATCSKLVGADVLFALGLLEVARLLLRGRTPPGDATQQCLPRPARHRSWRLPLKPLGGCAVVAAVGYLALLGTLDHFVGVEKNPVAHTQHMLTSLSAPHTHATNTGQTVSPESGPLQWMVDREPIPYWRQPAIGDALFDFRGFISPAIVLAAIPSLIFAGWSAVRVRDELGLLPLAWFGGTMAPFVYGVLIHRTSYLYYMVIVMPAIYIAIARSFLGRPRLSGTLGAIYAAGLLYNLAVFFPVRSWAGG